MKGASKTLSSSSSAAPGDKQFPSQNQRKAMNSSLTSLKKESTPGEIRQAAEKELEELIQLICRPKSNSRLKPIKAQSNSKNISVTESLKGPAILVKNTEHKKLLKELNQEISDLTKIDTGSDTQIMKDINSLFSGTKTASENSLRQTNRL